MKREAASKSAAVSALESLALLYARCMSFVVRTYLRKIILTRESQEVTPQSDQTLTSFTWKSEGQAREEDDASPNRS
jgi:hypothetical protein